MLPDQYIPETSTDSGEICNNAVMFGTKEKVNTCLFGCLLLLAVCLFASLFFRRTTCLSWASFREHSRPVKKEDQFIHNV